MYIYILPENRKHNATHAYPIVNVIDIHFLSRRTAIIVSKFNFRDDDMAGQSEERAHYSQQSNFF